MQDNFSEKLQVAYEGPALRQARMPMLALGTALRGQALLIARVGELLYGDAAPIQVEVDESFEAGSLIVPVHIFRDSIRNAEDLFAGHGFSALSNLLALLGFLGVNPLSIYRVFKKLHGRPVEKPSDIVGDLKLELSISVEQFVHIYNDKEVQSQLRKTLDPLRLPGIVEFQTRRAGEIIERVFETDLQAADEAEVENLTKDEEVDLAIEKAAWRRNLAWHFSDGRTSFDARIDDDRFWKRIEEGEAFADGDRLRVHLRTSARRTAKGTLKVERRIPEVLDVEHARRNTQRKMFDEADGSES